MDASLTAVINTIMQAKRPEDIFGQLTGTPAEQRQAAKRRWRSLSLVVHPDVQGGNDQAQAAFSRVSEFWAQAQATIASGQYGQAPATPVVEVRSRRQIYLVGESLARGDLANLYHCQWGDEPSMGILKVARNASDNDLMQAEADVLRHLHSVDRPEAERFVTHLPRLVESFGLKQVGTAPRTANVFAAAEPVVSLEIIRQAYPAGIDPRDMAWMWRRLLAVLGYVHRRRIIHGAVLPRHVLIQPEQHGLLLVDWCYSVREPADTAAFIPALSQQYEAWYPPEVLAKAPPRPGVDLGMSARCMVWLMGGDPLTATLPAHIPRSLQAFFRGCLLGSPRQQPQDAWALLDEFDELIGRLWGKRTFRPFSLPA